MADEGIVSRAGIIQELVMVRDGLLCMSTDDFTQRCACSDWAFVCRLILYFYVFFSFLFCFLFVYLVYDFYINNCKTTCRYSGQYVYVGFSGRRISHTSAYTIAEKAIRFRHPDYNPDQTQKLISSSMSRHLSTCNISSKSMYVLLSNLANRQTDRQTNVGKNSLTSSFVGGNKNRTKMKMYDYYIKKLKPLYLLTFQIDCSR